MLKHLFFLYHQKPLIGVKGRLQTWILDNEDGTKSKKMEIIAEKVTFISSQKNLNENNDEKAKAINEENGKPKKQKN